MNKYININYENIINIIHNENNQHIVSMYYLYITVLYLQTNLDINLVEYENLLHYFLVNRNINNDIINNYNIIINKLNTLINNFVIPENNRNNYITYSLYLFVIYLQIYFNLNLIEYEELLSNYL
jgi:hypothetical protein